jgi:hypothetical protein
MAVDFTIAGVSFGAAWVGVAFSNLCIWGVRRRKLQSDAARRALGRFMVVDTLLNATFLGLVFASVQPSLWLMAAVLVAGTAKIMLLDVRLERWRDAGVAAGESGHRAGSEPGP